MTPAYRGDGYNSGSLHLHSRATAGKRSLHSLHANSRGPEVLEQHAINNGYSATARQQPRPAVELRKPATRSLGSDPVPFFDLKCCVFKLTGTIRSCLFFLPPAVSDGSSLAVSVSDEGNL